MTRRAPIAAILATVTIISLSACGSVDSEPSSDASAASETPSQESSADSETPTTEEPVEQPAVFDALACDEVATPTAEVFACHRGKSMARFWVGGDPAEVVPTVMRYPGFNPNGDVFFSTDEGVLYLPGDPAFFDAQLALADPNDAYGAEVIDTDAL